MCDTAPSAYCAGFLCFRRCGVSVGSIQQPWPFPESRNVSFNPSKIRRKKSITAYSPTTGTYQMSPFSSPSTRKEQKCGNGPSNGKRKWNNISSPARKESTAKDSDEFMVLLSKIERSSEKTMEIMKNLRSIQALENNRQLEDLIGVSLAPCFLKGEVEKTRELKDHLDSFEFLKAILN
ncbi:centromere protein R isoform X2 [Phodopus roborovskii]|uniref:centromere protein R isoform X2 n=1 Tax=Phodopus roborovskii TaxID=109678 RepID=UPI0021E3F1D9|nr:centromere protein R isoform X2 [Phodopus roborovskii]